MTTWVPGVDASFTDEKVVSVEKMQALKAAGVKVWMQCIWTASSTPPVAVDNLRNAITADLIPLGYISLAGNVPGEWHVKIARKNIPDDVWDALLLVVIDVELKGIPNVRIREAVDYTASLGKGKAIYTSYGQWTGNQANATDFTDCWLFNAMWDQNPDVDFASLPYGGWTVEQVMSEQYTGGTRVEGIFVDRDSFNLEALEGLMALSQDDLNRIGALVGVLLDAKLGTDAQKQSMAAIVKLELEQFRQELEQAGQLPAAK